MKVVLSLGSNMGDRINYLKRAQKFIDLKCGKVVACSKIYETASWGKTNQPAYLNQVLVINSNLGPYALFNRLKKIEKQLGRKEKGKLMPRTIDIDILFYGDAIINAANLTVPHPRLHLRKFNLLPLTEIAADFFHPILQKSVSQLKKECEDHLEVSVYSVH